MKWSGGGGVVYIEAMPGYTHIHTHEDKEWRRRLKESAYRQSSGGTQKGSRWDDGDIPHIPNLDLPPTRPFFFLCLPPSLFTLLHTLYHVLLYVCGVGQRRGEEEEKVIIGGGDYI